MLASGGPAYVGSGRHRATDAFQSFLDLLKERLADPTGDRSQDAMDEAVAARFRELSSTRAVTLAERPPSVVRQGGLLVAALASRDFTATPDGTVVLGILHVTAPQERKLALVSGDGIGIPPGDYFIEVEEASARIGLATLARAT